MPISTLMTETVDIELLDESGPSRRGAISQARTTIATGLKASIRAIPAGYSMPAQFAGQDQVKSTHQMRRDAPILWTDPETSQQRGDLDQRCRVIWHDPASLRTRTLVVTNPSLHGRFTHQWVTYLSEDAT